MYFVMPIPLWGGGEIVDIVFCSEVDNVSSVSIIVITRGLLYVLEISVKLTETGLDGIYFYSCVLKYNGLHTPVNNQNWNTSYRASTNVYLVTVEWCFVIDEVLTIEFWKKYILF